MQSGSMLFTCSCSSAIRQQDMIGLLRQVSVQTMRPIRVLGCFGAAPDHPTLPSFPEGQYLQAVLLSVL